MTGAVFGNDVHHRLRQHKPERQRREQHQRDNSAAIGSQRRGGLSAFTVSRPAAVSCVDPSPFLSWRELLRPEGHRRRSPAVIHGRLRHRRVSTERSQRLGRNGSRRRRGQPRPRHRRARIPSRSASWKRSGSAVRSVSANRSSSAESLRARNFRRSQQMRAVDRHDEIDRVPAAAGLAHAVDDVRQRLVGGRRQPRGREPPARRWSAPSPQRLTAGGATPVAPRPTMSATAASAASSFSASLPPASASSGRPPPRPSTIAAVSRTMSPALTPRATRSGVTIASRLGRPSMTAPSTTTPGAHAARASDRPSGAERVLAIDVGAHGQHPHAVDLDGAIEQIARSAAASSPAQALVLPLQTADALLQAVDLRPAPRPRSRARARPLASSDPLLAQHALDRRLAGQRLDAAHARRDAPLGDDQERTDLAGGARRACRRTAPARIPASRRRAPRRRTSRRRAPSRRLRRPPGTA